MKQESTYCCSSSKAKDDLQKEEILEIFHDSVERFEQLRTGIEEFNAVFSWVLFVRQALTMVKICCFCYLLLKGPSDTGFPGAVIFVYAVVAIYVKFGSILNGMGATMFETKEFATQWRKVLMVIAPLGRTEEEKKLNRCSPFGFRMGVFYTVKPHTLLTFSSVVLTYLILLLQLK